MRTSRKVLIAIPALIGCVILVFVILFFFHPSLILVGSLPSFSDKIEIYKTVIPDVNIEYVKTLGATFGLTGDIREGNDGFSIQDKSIGAELGVSKATGTIDYEVSSKLYPKEKPVLPSDEEAMKIAMDFLSERGLLPDGDVASRVSRGGSTGYGTAHLLIGFTHTPNIIGPGAKRSVRIGNNGEVIEAFINPVKLEPSQTLALKSVYQAFKELKATRGKFAPMDTYWITVDRVSIAYWLEPVDKTQEYAYPVYVFSGHCRGIFGNERGTYTGLINATDVSSISFPAIASVYQGFPFTIMSLSIP